MRKECQEKQRENWRERKERREENDINKNGVTCDIRRRISRKKDVTTLQLFYGLSHAILIKNAKNELKFYIKTEKWTLKTGWHNLKTWKITSMKGFL